MDVSALNTVFPKTIEILHEKKISYLQEQYKKTLQQQLMLSETADTSRWFPVFLKFQGIRPEILEVAEFEYLRHLVSGFDSDVVELKEGLLCLNSSAQFVELHHCQPKLNRDSGLYCFFKKQNELIEFKLNICQALVIDLLQEDRRFSLEQLSLQATTHKMGKLQSLAKWKETIFQMVQVGLLVSQAQYSWSTNQRASNYDN